MKCKVLKFGGTSLANADSIKKVENIIRNTKNIKAIVVSAPGKSEKYNLKVTDALLLAYQNPSEYDYYINYVKTIFADIVSGLNIYFDFSYEFEKINKHFKRFKTKSYLLSRGEYIISKILGIYLNIKVIDSKNLIKFSTNGKILQKTYTNIRKSINNYGLIIIPGFYGSNRFNKIMVMCRGGSDITGSIVSRSLKNCEYYNYTDVEGVFDITPNLSDGFSVLKKINYDDIKFLSFYGAGVLHYKCCNIFNNGRTIIKNTFNEKAKGTIIEHKKHSIKNAITVTKGIQISFLESNKSLRKLISKLKHEKLYEFYRMGEVFYGLRIDNNEQQQKIINKLLNSSLNSYNIVVFGVIGDIERYKNIIKFDRDDCVLWFKNLNKTNIVFIDK